MISVLRAVACAVFCNIAASASADMFTDFLILDQSYCTGNGGRHDGISCNYSGGDTTRQRLVGEYEEELAAAAARADAYEVQLIEWLLDLDPDLSAFDVDGDVAELVTPASPDISRHYVCLHASLFALLMAAENPSLFAESANFYDWQSSTALNVHGMAAFWHIREVFALSGGHGKLGIEHEAQRKQIVRLLARELRNSIGAMAIRLADFRPSDASGVWKQDSILSHIGFYPRASDRYESLFSRMDCQSPATMPLAERYSPHSLAFVSKFVTPAVFDLARSFELTDLIPPEVKDSDAMSAEVEALHSLLKSAEGRPYVRLADIQFPDGALKYLIADGSGAALHGLQPRLVELRSGDFVPGYAEMSYGGFAVGETIFVTSFESFLTQPDRVWIRMFQTGRYTTPEELEGFLIGFSENPNAKRAAVEFDVETFCSVAGC